jgi:Zn-dependent metalloprotease
MMPKRLIPLSIAIAAILSSAAQAASHEHNAAHILTRGIATVDQGVDSADGRYAADGAAVAIYSPNFKAKRAAPHEMAKEFMAARHSDLGLRADEIDGLEVSHTRSDSDFSVVRFKQHVQGLPVFGSDVAVTVAPDGEVIFVASAAVRGLGSVDTAARINSVNALDNTKAYLGTAATRYETAEQVVYLDENGETRLAWHTTVIATDGLRGTWEVIVDAHSGEVIRAEDTNAYVDGTAKVFYPDPLAYTRSTYGQTGYVDGNDADTPQLTAARADVTLRDITFSGGNYSLTGPYAVCWEWESPNDNDCPVQASSLFDYTRSHLHFEAVNAYYHLDTFMRYVNETLGVAAMPRRHTGGVRFDAHGEGGADNSHYSSATDELVFGEGGVDDAEDGDVLVHELGHAIHNWVTNGGLSQQQGLSEGTGDYLAMAYGHSFPNQWTPADAPYYWVFRWDGHNAIWAGRVTNYQLTRTYQNLPTTIHTAGQYWASCNREAREAIGGQLMDKVFLKGLSMTTSSSNQKVAAQAVINAAATMGYSQAQIDAIGHAYNSGNTGGNTGCTYAVTIPTAVAGPTVAVAQTSLSGTAEVGGTDSTSLTIGNTGSAALNWTVDTSNSATCATSTPTSWLAFAPASGSTAQGGSTPVTVNFNAGILSAGNYSAYVCVRSNDTATPVVAVPVTLAVTVANDIVFADGFDDGGAPSCSPEQLFQDPGLEATNNDWENPYWGSTDSIGGVSFCDDTCDDGGNIIARTGNWFAWFGGWDLANTATLSQTVTFPSGQARWLNYWMINQIGGDTTASLRLTIDGNTVFNFPALSGGGSAWQPGTFQIPAQYLDGNAHEVKFNWSANAPGGNVGGAMFDDLTLDCQSQIARPAEPLTAPSLIARKRQ